MVRSVSRHQGQGGRAAKSNNTLARVESERAWVMSTTWIVSAWLMALVLAGCASSSIEGSRVRVVYDAKLVRGCQVLGTVADNELEDLQKKAAKLGGNVALLTPQRVAKGGYFGLEDYETADVYRCGGAR